MTKAVMVLLFNPKDTFPALLNTSVPKFSDWVPPDTLIGAATNVPTLPVRVEPLNPNDTPLALEKMILPVVTDVVPAEIAVIAG